MDEVGGNGLVPMTYIFYEGDIDDWIHRQINDVILWSFFKFNDIIEEHWLLVKEWWLDYGHLSIL